MQITRIAANTISNTNSCSLSLCAKNDDAYAYNNMQMNNKSDTLYNTRFHYIYDTCFYGLRMRLVHLYIRSF